MLNTRGVFDPRFAYFARPVVRGAMWADITVSEKITSSSWDPYDSDGNTDYEDGFTYKALYTGPARLQPNNDWRARKYRVAGELVTEHAMRIQLDLTGNTIHPAEHTPGAQDKDGNWMPGDAGAIQAGHVVKVNSIADPYGFPVDSMNTGFTFEVRVVNSSSNSWTRVLLCDFIGQHYVES